MQNDGESDDACNNADHENECMQIDASLPSDVLESQLSALSVRLQNSNGDENTHIKSNINTIIRRIISLLTHSERAMYVYASRPVMCSVKASYGCLYHILHDAAYHQLIPENDMNELVDFLCSRNVTEDEFTWSAWCLSHTKHKVMSSRKDKLLDLYISGLNNKYDSAHIKFLCVKGLKSLLEDQTDFVIARHAMWLQPAICCFSVSSFPGGDTRKEVWNLFKSLPPSFLTSAVANELDMTDAIALLDIMEPNADYCHLFGICVLFSPLTTVSFLASKFKNAVFSSKFRFSAYAAWGLVCEVVCAKMGATPKALKFMMKPLLELVTTEVTPGSLWSCITIVVSASLRNKHDFSDLIHYILEPLVNAIGACKLTHSASHGSNLLAMLHILADLKCDCESCRSYTPFDDVMSFITGFNGMAGIARFVRNNDVTFQAIARACPYCDLNNDKVEAILKVLNSKWCIQLVGSNHQLACVDAWRLSMSVMSIVPKLYSNDALFNKCDMMMEMLQVYGEPMVIRGKPANLLEYSRMFLSLWSMMYRCIPETLQETQRAVQFVEKVALKLARSYHLAVYRQVAPVAPLFISAFTEMMGEIKKRVEVSASPLELYGRWTKLVHDICSRQMRSGFEIWSYEPPLYSAALDSLVPVAIKCATSNVYSWIQAIVILLVDPIKSYHRSESVDVTSLDVFSTIWKIKTEEVASFLSQFSLSIRINTDHHLITASKAFLSILAKVIQRLVFTESEDAMQFYLLSRICCAMTNITSQYDEGSGDVCAMTETVDDPGAYLDVFQKLFTDLTFLWRDNVRECVTTVVTGAMNASKAMANNSSPIDGDDDVAYNAAREEYVYIMDSLRFCVGACIPLIKNVRECSRMTQCLASYASFNADSLQEFVDDVSLLTDEIARLLSFVFDIWSQRYPKIEECAIVLQHCLTSSIPTIKPLSCELYRKLFSDVVDIPSALSSALRAAGLVASQSPGRLLQSQISPGSRRKRILEISGRSPDHSPERREISPERKADQPAASRALFTSPPTLDSLPGAAGRHDDEIDLLSSSRQKLPSKVYCNEPNEKPISKPSSLAMFVDAIEEVASNIPSQKEYDDIPLGRVGPVYTPPPRHVDHSDQDVTKRPNKTSSPVPSIQSSIRGKRAKTDGDSTKKRKITWATDIAKYGAPPESSDGGSMDDVELREDSPVRGPMPAIQKNQNSMSFSNQEAGYSALRFTKPPLLSMARGLNASSMCKPVTSSPLAAAPSFPESTEIFYPRLVDCTEPLTKLLHQMGRGKTITNKLHDNGITTIGALCKMTKVSVERMFERNANMLLQSLEEFQNK